MQVKRWWCKADGIQETSIRGRGESAMCPLCGQRMAAVKPDPRVQAAPRGEARPPRPEGRPL